MPAGSYVVLLGPSGSGKTTLLSILGGFLTPSAGTVLIDGTDVTDLPPARRPTATVFQDYALFPHLSVAGNVGVRSRPCDGVPRAERSDEDRRNKLALVSIEGFDIPTHSFSSPVANDNAWRWPAPWSWSQRSFSLTSPWVPSTWRCGVRCRAS